MGHEAAGTSRRQQIKARSVEASREKSPEDAIACLRQFSPRLCGAGLKSRDLRESKIVHYRTRIYDDPTSTQQRNGCSRFVLQTEREA